MNIKRWKPKRQAAIKEKLSLSLLENFLSNIFFWFFFVDNKYFNKVYVYMCVYIHGWHDGFNAVSEESLEPPQDRGECVQ